MVHHFSDTQQEWQAFSDGQMGRKIAGLINHSVFNGYAEFNTWRIIDDEFAPGTYGYLMDDMVKIHSLTTSLPDGSAFGIISRFSHQTGDKSWSEFILNRLTLFKENIKQYGLFSTDLVDNVTSIATQLNGDFRKITPSPFLWDASERNVLVEKGKITGIVDVDDMCFGDPLFVVALTSISLAVEGLDTKYTDYWAELLNLDDQGKYRLAFYRLFYVITFMRKHGMKTSNSKSVMYNTQILLDLYQQSFNVLRHDGI